MIGHVIITISILVLIDLVHRQQAAHTYQDQTWRMCQHPVDSCKRDDNRGEKNKKQTNLPLQFRDKVFKSQTFLELHLHLFLCFHSFYGF